jgi:hypothetical protein
MVLEMISTFGIIFGPTSNSYVIYLLIRPIIKINKFYSLMNLTKYLKHMLSK